MNEPKSYDMTIKEDRLRWFDEMDSYLKTEDFVEQGTDLKGRQFALDAFHQLKKMEEENGLEHR